MMKTGTGTRTARCRSRSISDLGARKRVAALGINQRERSPTYNRQTFGRQQESSRIKGYTVATSRDGVQWRHERSGTLARARAIQYIELGGRARYVRLTVQSTWGSPTVPAYYNKLAIDEMYVVGGYVRARYSNR